MLKFELEMDLSQKVVNVVWPVYLPIIMWDIGALKRGAEKRKANAKIGNALSS
jgi:hypothetical protein